MLRDVAVPTIKENRDAQKVQANTDQAIAIPQK